MESENEKIKYRILKSLEESEINLTERMRQPLVEPRTFLAWNGVRLLSPGTICTIQGKAGSHKTRLVQEFVKVLLSQKGCEYLNKLGISRIFASAICIGYLDTELSSNYELPSGLKTIANDSCLGIPSPLFRYASIRDIPRRYRRLAAQLFFEKIRKSYDGDLCVIVDVASDLSMDFNSVSDTGEIIDLLKIWMNVYNCAIIAVIHENPGISDKMRGHLGTELLNKATDSIKIALDADDSIKIKFVKCRGYKKPGVIEAHYNEATNRLELKPRVDQPSNPKQFEVKLAELFSQNPNQSRQAIMLYTDYLGLSLDSRDNYLNALKEVLVNGDLYLVTKSKSGKETIYGIVKGESLTNLN